MDIELEDLAGGSRSSDDGDLREADDEQQYQRDWDDPESDDDIVLPAARLQKHEPRRKTTLTNLIQETRLRAGLGVNRRMTVAVHNLTFSLDVTLAKTTNPTILQDIRERWRVDKKEKITKKVLKNVSFVIQEKMMVLLLGPPGCGKTSLMRLLANDLPYGRAHGDMFFNKKSIDPDTHLSFPPPFPSFPSHFFLFPHRNVSYVTQQDAHVPSLTVRQTLEFAGNLLRDPNAPGAENVSVSDVADVVMQLLGLSHRADTIVGNEMIRGVSGGEKRRVTIGIELMKKPKFLLLDEATTGLDTARSVEIGKFCRIVADNFVPVLAALLQPPLRLYKRFDHILLMHEGRVAFFGPRVKVLEYFEEIGFRCPNWMNPADFLVAVLVRPDDFRIGDDRIVQTARDFADVYSQSAMYREIVLPMIRENYPDGVEPEEEPREWKRKKTENPLSRLRTTFSSFSKESKEYQGEDGDDEDQEILSPADDEEIEMRPPAFLGKQHQSFISDRRPNLTMKSQIESGPPPPTKFNTSAFFQFKMLTKRGLQSNRNFPAMIIFISIYSLFLATFYGTLFLQLGYTQADLSLRAGIVFNIVMILGFQANKANDTLFQERPVFILQRSKRYYSTIPYFFAQIVNTIPPLVLNVTLFACVAYWLIGLSDADGGSRFFFLILIGVLLQLACDGWIRTISQLNDSYITAQGMGPFSLGGFILLAGFFRRIEDLPWAVRWLSYISPFRWAYEASLINELAGQPFYCTSEELVPPTDTPGFNAPFEDGGYEGNQVCPIENGSQFLAGIGLETEQSWKYFCMLFMIILVVAFQTMAMLTLKFIRHTKPEMLRERYKSEDDDEENEWLLDIDAKAGSYAIEDLQEKRDAKPRVSLEATDLCYSVEGVVNEIEADEENQAGTGEGGRESSLSEIFEEEEGLIDTEENEFGNVSLLNKCGACLSTRCSCCPCCPSKMNVKLLDGISMKVEPGMMMALMGPSGAGKSTLMDVIAGRKTGGEITGEILFNGRERDQYFSRYTGYCEQQDLHTEYATVWEAVRLSAITRLPPSWLKEEKLANVKYVIERLRLASVAHVLVKNLRLEQRKRLTVAVEMVSNPSVLFLDEPTSGLDATEAAEIVRVIKEEAQKGMSVVCTIHQPSSQIFALFSHMLLLKKGGRAVFIGPCEEMRDYFQSQLGLRMPAYENPADFALEVASMPDGPNDPAEMWASFVRQRDAQLEVNQEMGPDDRKPSMSDRMSMARTAEYDSKYPASFIVQCKEILARSMKSLVRRPQDFRVRIIRNLLMGILAGGVFWDAGSGQTGPQTRLSSFFFLLIIATFNSFTQIALIIMDRPSFYRERLAGSYRALVYLLGLILPDLPIQLLSFLLYAIPQYFMAGMRTEPEALFYYFICGFGACVLSFCLVNLIAVAAFNAPVATLLAGVTITLSNMLAGFFIPKDQIPDWWIWGYYTSFVRYPLEGLTVNELAGQSFNCGPDGTEGAIPIPVGDNTQYYCPLTNGNQMIEELSMSASHKWPFLGVTYGLVAMFIFLCWAALVKIVHINR